MIKQLIIKNISVNTTNKRLWKALTSLNIKQSKNNSDLWHFVLTALIIVFYRFFLRLIIAFRWLLILRETNLRKVVNLL